MKKISFTVIIVALVDILFFFPILWFIGAILSGINFVGVYALGMDISYKNAPENTAFVDILLEEGCHNFKDFTATPKRYAKDGSFELLNIDGDSGIARLNSDGLVSAASHYGTLRVNEDGSVYLGSDTGTLPIPNYMREDIRFKAAYVDENGNVLKIIEPGKQRYNGMDCFTLTADGDSLVLGYPGRPEWFERLMYGVLFVIEVCALAGLIVSIILAIVMSVLRKRRKV
ncbi:MAG: hypothetical protein K2N38_12910 [Oscillospiraceae bacterium]|nr:hypothetical protein [Oscillospiraceae bacterium]